MCDRGEGVKIGQKNSVTYFMDGPLLTFFFGNYVLHTYGSETDSD